MFSVPSTREFSAEDIEHLCIAALEGGSNYWLDGLESSFSFKEESTWEQVLDGLDFWVTPISEEEEDPLERVQIDKRHVQTTLGKFLKLRGAGFDMDDHDAEDGDVFLQLLLLGDVVYG